MSGARHTPVMLNEVVRAAAPNPDDVAVDATFGAGGYTRGLLAGGASVVYGIDRDPSAIAGGAALEREAGGGFSLIKAPFSEMEAVLKARNVEAVDVIVFDLGVSSMQLDEAERGFSFSQDGPLSMRMDGAKPDVADVVAAASAEDLATIFVLYGQERHAKKIARAILRAREERAILTTGRLAKIITEAAPAGARQRIHPATRAFQALRIFVNDELGELRRALLASERLLRPAGRLIVVTFHSLEDRMVKRFLQHRSQSRPTGSRHAPVAEMRPPSFMPAGKALRPNDEEIGANPRARSAKMRVGVRTASPPWFDDAAFAPAAPSLSRSLAALIR